MRTLVDGARPAGVHSVTWDGRDDLGRSVAAGLYIYRISVDGHSRTGRMVLLDKRSTALPSSVPSVLTIGPRTEVPDGGAAAGYGMTISGPGIETFVVPQLDLQGGAWQSFEVARSAAEAVGSASRRPAAKVAATDGILGDVNGDGRSNISDALIIATYGISGSVVLPEGGDISLGDVNRDGRIDISDALIIATFSINPSSVYLPEGIGEPIVPPPITSNLFGFVRNRTGEPLQSAVIRLGGSLVTTTDANGFYQLSGIEADVGTTLSVELAGFRPHLAELSFSAEDLSYSVELNPVNLPVARAAADEVLVNVGDSVTLRAGDSVDPSQRGLAFTWSSVATNPVGVEFPANNSSNEAFAVSVTLPQPGEYRFRLVVDNGLAISDADTTLITANAFPTAVIQAPPAPLSVTSGEGVELKGEGDDLEDGRLEGGSVSWFSDLDGPLGSGTEVMAEALSVGTHHITLTATDAYGAADTAMVMVTVESGPPSIVAVSGDNQTLDLGQESGPLVISVIGEDGEAVPGRLVSVEILAGSATLSSGNGVTDEQGEFSTTVTSNSLDPLTVAVTGASVLGSVEFELMISVVFGSAGIEAAVRDAVGKPWAAVLLEDVVAVTDLDASLSNVQSLADIELLSALRVLRANVNQISDISALSQITNLEELRLGANQISDLSPLAGLTGLTALSLQNNLIADLDGLSPLSDLETLVLWGNQISDVSPLAELGDLLVLDLSDNDISDVSALGANTSLENLNLAGNQIGSISALVGLVDLDVLDLSSNLIAEVSPLSAMTALTDLDLSENGISDLSALAGLASLSSLNLKHNEISDLQPLVNNPDFAPEDVDLRNNLLTQTAIDVQIPALEARGVTVKW